MPRVTGLLCSGRVVWSCQRDSIFFTEGAAILISLSQIITFVWSLFTLDFFTAVLVSGLCAPATAVVVASTHAADMMT